MYKAHHAPLRRKAIERFRSSEWFAESRNLGVIDEQWSKDLSHSPAADSAAEKQPTSEIQVLASARR